MAMTIFIQYNYKPKTSIINYVVPILVLQHFNELNIPKAPSGICHAPGGMSCGRWKNVDRASRRRRLKERRLYDVLCGLKCKRSPHNVARRLC